MVQIIIEQKWGWVFWPNLYKLQMNKIVFIIMLAFVTLCVAAQVSQFAIMIAKKIARISRKNQKTSAPAKEIETEETEK